MINNKIFLNKNKYTNYHITYVTKPVNFFSTYVFIS